MVVRLYAMIHTILHQSVLLSTVSVDSCHVVTLTHSTIQNGWTALKQASINGHHMVVKLLLGAGANPDLQDKVSMRQTKILICCLIVGVHPLHLIFIFLVVHHENGTYIA